MIRVELHIENPDNPSAPYEWLAELKGVLIEHKLATEQCDFHITRNSSELTRSRKGAPFIRVVVTQDDAPGKIVSAIRKWLPIFDGLGIDIVTMPVYVQPGMTWSGRWNSKPRWYDPSDPLCASRHAQKERRT